MSEKIDIKRKRFTVPTPQAEPGKGLRHALGELQGFSDDVWEMFRRVGKLFDAFRADIDAIPLTKLDDWAEPDDNTDLDATTSAHGLMPKGTGSTTTFYRSDGTQAAPTSGGLSRGEALAISLGFDLP